MLQTVRKTALLASFVAFQFPIFHLFLSPVLSIAGAARGVVTASLATYGALALLSLVLGRAFCGWACPGAALQECCTIAGAKRIPSPRRYWTKYAIFTLWFMGVLIGAVHAGGFHRFEPLFGTEGGPAFRMFLLRYGALVIIVPFTFLAGRWASCHYICWIAPLLVLGTRIKERAGWSSLRLRADSERCISCDDCLEACPMSLPVRDMVTAGSMTNNECLLCGSCVSGCPSGAIRFAFEQPRRRTAAAPL